MIVLFTVAFCLIGGFALSRPVRSNGAGRIPSVPRPAPPSPMRRAGIERPFRRDDL